jgi:hypothetical protein
MITAGKLCRFVYAEHSRTNLEGHGRKHHVILFGGCTGWKSYPIDTVFVLMDNEEYTWKVLTPTGEVGNAYKSSYVILEVDPDHA